MLFIIATLLFARKRILLNCNYVNKITNQRGTFNISPPGSLLKKVKVTQGSLVFTFKLFGFMFYKLKTTILDEPSNIHVSQDDHVGWSIKQGYHLTNNVLDVSSDRFNLHCDQIENNRW